MNGLRPGVLFDLDGTLVDSNYLHTLAWSRALRDAGEWAPMNAIHRLVGMGGDELVEALFGRPAPEAVEARPARYAELAGEVRPFPAAASLLARLRALGLVVGLATSAPAGELSFALSLLGGPAALDFATGAEDAARAKPHPDIFLAAIARGGLDPRRCLAVGDSVWDARAASAASIGLVGLESGGFSADELSRAGALVVYRDLDELGEQLARSPIGELLD